MQVREGVNVTRQRAQSTQEVKERVAVILLRVVNSLFRSRPPFVTCVLLIGSAMYWVAAYLWLFPSKHATLGQHRDSLYPTQLLWSNALPCETFVHIGLFMLSAISYWKHRNLLAFAMCQLGLFFIAVHSVAAATLAAIALARANRDSTGVTALCFALWFLLPSLLGLRHAVQWQFDSAIHSDQAHTLLSRKSHMICSRIYFGVPPGKQSATVRQSIAAWRRLWRIWCSLFACCWSRVAQEQDYELVAKEDSEEAGAETDADADAVNERRDELCALVYGLVRASMLWYVLLCLCQVAVVALSSSSSSLSLPTWFRGFTASFTMAFHRAFLCACNLNVLFDAHFSNTLLIAAGANLISAALCPALALCPLRARRAVDWLRPVSGAPRPPLSLPSLHPGQAGRVPAQATFPRTDA